MKVAFYALAGLLGAAVMIGLMAFATNVDRNTAFENKAALQISVYVSAAQDKSVPPLSFASLKTDPILSAMVHPDRTQADIGDDGLRKVLGVLRFAGIRSGDNVLELEAGSGYYTELLSFIVGENGKVAMHNPPEFGEFVTPEVLAERLGADRQRLPNVSITKTSFDKLDAADGSVDLVTWFLGPHELWMTNAAGEMTLGDPAKTYAEIYRVLKPGGRFVALDKSSPDYTMEHESSVSHKISPKHVTARAEAAGFILAETSDLLSNKEQQYGTENKFDLNVVDPSKRVSTDRFLHLYIKPE